MIPIVAPRLTTARLVLRQLEARDFDTFAAQIMDPLAMAPLSPVPDRAAAWKKLASYNGMWTLTGAGWWGVELAEAHALVGTVGAFFRETNLAELEIGWTVFPEFRRRGIAVEAARAALEHGFASHSVPRVIAHVDAENFASAGVCRAIGMSLEGDVDFYGSRLARWVIARADSYRPTRCSSMS